MTSGHHHHLDHLDYLDHLWHTVLQLAEQVERGVVHAIGALKSHDWEMDHLQLPTDALIDQTQRTIQAEVATLTARHALGPTEVRLIVSTLVVANELAQISGQVEHIVETVAWRVPSPWMDVPGDLTDLADRTQLLLCTALHAYAQRNATIARQLIGSGATGDDLLCRIQTALSARMARRPMDRNGMMDHWSVARHLAHIANRATTIAEQTIFVVVGNVVDLRPVCHVERGAHRACACPQHDGNLRSHLALPVDAPAGNDGTCVSRVAQ